MEVSIGWDKGEDPSNRECPNRECPDHIGAVGTYAIQILSRWIVGSDPEGAEA